MITILVYFPSLSLSYTHTLTKFTWEKKGFEISSIKSSQIVTHMELMYI